MIYWQLFWSFLQVGAFSFGGGYAALPFIQTLIEDNHEWLTAAEFTDLITISQMTPGPIAINSATFVGLQIAGVGGAIAATIGNILPSFILVTGIATLYTKYKKLNILQSILTALRPAVVAMIATAGVTIIMSAFWGEGAIILSETNLIAVIIFSLSVFLLMKFKLNPITVIILSGVLNVIWAFLSGAI